jgi:hypothetical protein
MKRRTGLLFSCAVVAGLLGGGAVGYEVQNHRAPTPLPSLDPALPAAAGAAPAAAPDPATDDAAKLDGDLRTLLIDKPSDAKDPQYIPGLSWVTAYSLAESRGSGADHAFVELGNAGFRRAAQRAWVTAGGQTVEISVIQFRTSTGAVAFQSNDGVTSGDNDVPGTSGHAFASPGPGTDRHRVLSGRRPPHPEPSDAPAP